VEVGWGEECVVIMLLGVDWLYILIYRLLFYRTMLSIHPISPIQSGHWLRKIAGARA
jgi:hypothetical protein